MTATRPRSQALDALRGIAVLAMCLSGVVPYRSLPAWMYHAQLPPPERVFRPEVPGITWVDLVFPFFLFSLGAALPLALGPRLERGEKATALAYAALRRGLVLAAFALYAQAVQPYLLASEPGPREWWLALLGFALAMPVLARLPDSWSPATRLGVRAAGLFACSLFLANIRYADGTGFRLERVDIILLVLANVVVTASWIWLATRDRPAWRAVLLGLLCVIFAFWRHAGLPAFVPESPLPWLARLDFQKYLIVVLPGTFAGELLARATADRAREPGRERGAALALLAAIAVATTSFFVRELALGALVTAILLGVALRLDAGRIAQPYVRLALPLLALGFLADPFEGGIVKDSANLAYLTGTAGLASVALAALRLSESRSSVPWAVRRCADVGRNPMLAYLAIRNVLAPVWALTGIGGFLNGLLTGAWTGALHAALKTAALAHFAGLCTRWRIVWRS